MDNLSTYFNKVFSKITTNKITLSLICVLFGALGAIPYFHEKLFVFTFISLFSQFLIVIHQRRVKGKVFLPFFMYFLGFYIPLYLFLSELYPYERFGFEGTQAIFILLCSCICIPFLHATVEAIILSIAKFIPDNAVMPIGISSLWVVGEWILTLGTLAFPWGNIAVSLTGFLPYLQTASLFGQYFISFITVLSCCYLAMAIYDKKRIFAIIGALVIIFNSLLGIFIYLLPYDNSDNIPVACIQGNALSNEKWSASNRTEIFDRYISLTEEAAINGAKIIILPESAIPVTFKENGILHNALSEIAKMHSTTIITGINYYENGNQYNSVIAILPDGSLSKRYDKRHLVPFGEFIPFVDVIGKIVPFVGEFSADSGEYAEGTEPTVIDTEFGKVAPLVCFDSIFSEFAADGINNGAEILAIVTNDSWFNDSIGIYTHLRHAQLRAIENNKFVMRAANTGISACIDSKGNIISSSLPLEIDIIYSNIEFNENVTLFSIIGDIVVYISFAIIIILIIYNIRRKNNGKDPTARNRDL